MAREDPYEEIEENIRTELATIRECDLQESISNSTVVSLDERETRLVKGLIVLDRDVALRNVGILLGRLPTNYHSFSELKEAYLNLI
jgi:hypothetical protein